MGKKRFIQVISDSADLTSASLSKTTSLDKDFRLLGVYFHASTNITETCKVFKDSNEGANYDSELATNGLSGEDDYLFRPTGEEIFIAGDEVKVTCTNGNTTGSMYVTIYIEEI